MRAMVLEKPGSELRMVEMPVPEPAAGRVLLRVHACAVCRTDLHVLDGELTDPKLPLIPGHEIIGSVAAAGRGASKFAPGDRVGVPWLGHTCGACLYCCDGRENLCDNALFTGYQIDGGYAEYCVADERFCFPIPDSYPDIQAAPLLCAGLIGYRAYRMTEEAKTLGLYGFGAAAHILAQVARHDGKRIFAFTRPGDTESMDFALGLGAEWAGESTAEPPEPLDAAIIFAPAGELLPIALAAVAKGGLVVCAGIYMSAIPSFSYELLWHERQVRSVANLTRRDGEEFFAIAPEVPVRTQVKSFPLERANEALAALRAGEVRGAAVLVMPAVSSREPSTAGRTARASAPGTAS